MDNSTLLKAMKNNIYLGDSFFYFKISAFFPDVVNLDILARFESSSLEDISSAPLTIQVLNDSLDVDTTASIGLITHSDGDCLKCVCLLNIGAVIVTSYI